MNLRIMTYNIGHYDYGLGVGLPSNIYAEKTENYQQYFDGCGCDIVGLQEWAEYLDQAQTVKSNPTIFNPYFPSNGGNTDIWCALKGNNILFYDRQAGSINNRPYVKAKTIINKHVVSVYSVHFSPGANNASARVTEANALLQMVASEKYFIICGDFNPEPSDEDSLFALFTAQGLHLANCGSFGKFSTWHNNSSYHIDNIITSSNINILSVKADDVYSKLSSDHIPLIADIQVI